MRTSSSASVRSTVPAVRQLSWWARLWQPFWALPTVMSLFAFAAGIVLPLLEQHLRSWALWMFPGGVDAARSALTTIASISISTVGVVFSITMVVLQLASNQFTPRILGSFLESRIVQVTFGIFISTFVFSLTVLRSIRDSDQTTEETFPRVSISISFLLALACVACFLAFIRSITVSIQVRHAIRNVGDETMALIEAMSSDDDEAEAPEPWTPPDNSPSTTIAVDAKQGHINELDIPSLVKVAKDYDGVVVLTSGLGAFKIAGQTCAEFWGEGWDEEGDRRVNAALRITTDRSLQQDMSFGFRQLLDISLRALSPGINDPATAVQTIDEIHRLLRRLVQMKEPLPYVPDSEGVTRVVLPAVDINATLAWVIEELNYFGRESIQIPRRLFEMIDDLSTCALPEYQGTLAEMRETIIEPKGFETN